MLFNKLLLFIGFFTFTPIFLVVTVIYYTTNYSTNYSNIADVNEKVTLAHDVISSDRVQLPTVLGAYTFADAIPVVVTKYLKHYKSTIPADIIVKYANENNVDPRLIVAIAQQESNLGKGMPEGCHNAWGYGIHAKGTLCFDSWEEGIETVIKGISKNYCQKGLCDDPCVMMKKYTPSSNGSWCYGVNQFMEEMRTGNF